MRVLTRDDRLRGRLITASTLSEAFKKYDFSNELDFDISLLNTAITKNCPYCQHTEMVLREAKGSMSESKFTVELVFLDKMAADDAPLVQMELMKRTRQKTVPNIFIGGKHVGGDSHLTDLYDSGELLKMLSTGRY